MFLRDSHPYDKKYLFTLHSSLLTLPYCLFPIAYSLITEPSVSCSLVKGVVTVGHFRGLYSRAYGSGHTEIPEGIGKMVLTVGVKILGDGIGKLKQRKRPYCRLAGIEEIHHGSALPVKAHTVVALHPAGDALVVPP